MACKTIDNLFRSLTFFPFFLQTRLLPLSVNTMHQQRLSNSYCHHPTTVLPSSQTMVLNNNPTATRIKRDTHSCDDIVDHCNNNGDNDNQLRNPYAKISLDKLNSGSRNCFVSTTQQPPLPLPPPIQFQQTSSHQSYHPHSIFYGQHYHRIQPIQQSSTFGNNFNNVPIQLTDSHRHSGSSFRSSNTQSPPSMMDEEMKVSEENPYECIPGGPSFPQPQEAVTRFDN